MADSLADATPAVPQFFSCTIDTLDLGVWSTCSGLSATIDVQNRTDAAREFMAHPVTPGGISFGRVKLTRPVAKYNYQILSWFNSFTVSPKRLTAEITALDQNGKPLLTWNLYGVVPSSWSGPSFDINATGKVPEESLEIAFEGFSLSDSPGSGGAGGSMPGASTAQLEVKGVGVIKFPYNPQQWSVTKEALWNTTPQTAAKEGGVPQFQGTKAQSMTLPITLDRFGEMPIDPDEAIKTLFAGTAPTAESTQKKDAKPPVVLVQWGREMIMEQAYIKSVKITKKDLNPTTGQLNLAEAEVVLEAIPQSVAGQNPTSGALASKRTHTMIDGDSLASVAYAEYGNPTRWRALAAANKIDDPMRVRPGTVLIVPDASEVEELA